jgi:hypothetical protein
MKLLMKLFSKKTALQVKLSCAKRALKENWLHLFLSKGRRAAVSFKKEVIEHHEPKLTTPPQKQHTQTNSANKTLHHLNVGEKPKEAAANRAVITNIVSRQKPRPAASQSGNLNSSTTSPSSSGRTPLAVDPMLRPSVGKKLLSWHQCNHWSRPLCVGVSPHPPPHTPLPRTQISEAVKRATLPPNHHRGPNRNKHADSRPLAPWLLCTSLPTRTKLWQPAQENTVLSPKPIHFGH